MEAMHRAMAVAHIELAALANGVGDVALGLAHGVFNGRMSWQKRSAVAAHLRKFMNTDIVICLSHPIRPAHAHTLDVAETDRLEHFAKKCVRFSA